MIHALYKVPIWIEDDTLSQDKLDTLEQACYDKCSPLPDYPDEYNPDIFKFSRSNKVNVHTVPEFKEASDLMINAARNMMLGMGYTREQADKLKIANSWFGIYKNGDNLPMHTHRNSVFSGAYYIKDLTDCKLRFIHDIYRNTPYPDDLYNEWGKNVTDIDCNAGRLIVFPSDCIHGINQMKSNLPDNEVIKVMLSYNFKMG